MEGVDRAVAIQGLTLAMESVVMAMKEILGTPRHGRADFHEALAWTCSAEKDIALVLEALRGALAGRREAGGNGAVSGRGSEDEAAPPPR